jgi:hypothetical protein
MSIDKRWILLIAVAAGAAGGVVVALTSRNRKHRIAGHLQHKEDIKSWENEGGNLKPAPTPSAEARA